MWYSVDEKLPVVDDEVIVLDKNGCISFGHIVDPNIAESHNGWNIPDVAFWMPFEISKAMAKFYDFNCDLRPPCYECKYFHYEQGAAYDTCEHPRGLNMIEKTQRACKKFKDRREPKTCRNCVHRERWDKGNKVISYCNKLPSSHSVNGMRVVKCNQPACGWYKEQKGKDE